MKMRLDTSKSKFDTQLVFFAPYLVHYDILLHNLIDIITKSNSYFITQRNKSLLLNALGFLLQNGTVLLQIVPVITKHVDFITKCDSYYKIRWCMV